VESRWQRTLFHFFRQSIDAVPVKAGKAQAGSTMSHQTGNAFLSTQA
jgi:hypothetical protein